MAANTAKAKRSIRVFVSSTFRDMIEDRNELMTHCWPQLREFCQERQVEFAEVDLRWGISEEQSSRKETLQLCLDEIKNCRPYFVGLLGERYGWVPGSDAYSASLLQQESWLQGQQDKSVTELEILHGVLNNPQMAGRSYFFFRDPAFVLSIPEEKQADFRTETQSELDKLEALKGRIRQASSTGSLFIKEGYAQPRSLAEMVLEQLKAAIEEEFPLDDQPDPLDKEASDHEAFAELRRRTYIGRPEYYAILDQHAGASGGPLVLLGESGSGKSTLIANWLEHWKEQHPDDFIFQHYIGGTSDSANHWKLMRRLVKEIKRWTDDPEEVPSDNDTLRRDFQLWLNKARFYAERRGCRCVLILDALNQLEDTENCRLLAWLPSEPIKGALRLIVSTLPGDTLEALNKRKWETVSVQPLRDGERRQMILHYLQRFGQTLESIRLDRIIAAPQTANPLWLKIMLDELRVTGSFEGLDALIDDYLKAIDIPSLLQKVLARYRRDYERDRPGLVKDSLSLIYASRRGLSETELLQLLKPEDLPQLPRAIWAPLRAALLESLVDKGGILNFAHDYLKQAVEKVWLTDLDSLDETRLLLADFFESLPPSMRSCDELPWLLFETESLDRLRDCLLQIPNFLYIHDRDKDELRRYWVDMYGGNALQPLGDDYVDSFQKMETGFTSGDSSISYAAIALAYFLNELALHQSAEPMLRHALKIDEASYGQEHPRIAIGLSNLGSLLYSTNRLAEAEPLLRRALKIDETSYGPEDPRIAKDLNNLALLLQAANHIAEAESLLRRALDINEARYGPENPTVAVALNNLATMLFDINRFEEAEPLMRRALKIDQTILGPENPQVAVDLNNLAALLQANNRLREAEQLMRQALKIDEASYGPEHPTVGIDLNNLGSLLQDAKRMAEAEPLLRRALSINEVSYGLEHPKVASTLNNLASLLCVVNRPSEAEAMMRRALKIAETSYGSEHPEVAPSLNNLAQMLQTTNRLAEAEPFMRRVVVIFLQFTRLTGHQHPHLQTSVGNYAWLLQQSGKSREEILEELRGMGLNV